MSKVQRSACSVRLTTLDERLDGLEARLARIAALGLDPIDVLGGGVEAGLDAAMALLDGGFGDEFVRRRRFEIVVDLGFQGRLIALQRQQEIGLVRDDLGGDLDLTAHGVDGDEGAFELPRLGELVEQIGDGGDLVGLLGHAELRQRQPGVGRVGAERMQGLEPLALVVGAARGLAVDGDEVVPARPQRRDPAVETAPEQDRIDPVDQVAQPAFAGNSMMERREPPQKIEMMLAPGDDVVEIVAGGDGGAGQQQQDFGQRIDDPPRLAFVRRARKNASKARPRAPGASRRPEHHRPSAALLFRIKATQGITAPAVNAKSPHRPVNLTSPPWIRCPFSSPTAMNRSSASRDGLLRFEPPCSRLAAPGPAD